MDIYSIGIGFEGAPKLSFSVIRQACVNKESDFVDNDHSANRANSRTTCFSAPPAKIYCKPSSNAEGASSKACEFLAV